MERFIDNVYAKGIITVCWIAGVCSFGIGVTPGMTSSWLALAAIALLPPTVMLHLWREPAATLSQRIDRGRQ